MRCSMPKTNQACTPEQRSNFAINAVTTMSIYFIELGLFSVASSTSSNTLRDILILTMVACLIPAAMAFYGTLADVREPNARWWTPASLIKKGFEKARTAYGWFQEQNNASDLEKASLTHSP